MNPVALQAITRLASGAMEHGYIFGRLEFNRQN